MKSGITREAMDTAVRPQDDLFGHVNGTWLATTEIPGDRRSYGTFDMLRDAAERDLRVLIEQAAAADDAQDGSARRKVGNLFTSFMDQAGVEELAVSPLARPLDRIEAVRDVEDLVRLVGSLQREGVDGFLHVIVSTDDRQSDQYIAYLEQHGIGLPDESYYREEAYAPIRAAYVEHVTTMLAFLPEADGSPGASGPADAAARVMALETRLAASHWDKVAARDAVRSYTKVDRAGLGELAPRLDWSAWAAALGGPQGALDTVIVRQPSYLTGLAAALAEVPLEDWKDWLRWRLVHSLAPYLSDEVVVVNFEFYGRTLTGTPELRERWKRGVALVDEALGEAAGQLYVEQHFPPEAKARMVELVGNLVQAYQRDFETLPWMSEETRTSALAKLAAFRSKIGYPDKWRDYSSLRIDPGDLIGNVQRAGEFETDRELGKIGRPIDRSEWFMTPQTVNAYYHPGMNEIVFPAAILQPPFFDVEADDAVNYGAIGAVIGHEIGHGFDDQGSRYDGAGNLNDWWTDDDRQRFEARSQQLVEQFGSFETRDAPGHQVNGALTVGENIGDLGGLTIGYAAYRIATEGCEPSVIDGFTGDQRFFIGWAQAWKGKVREQEAVRRLAVDPHAPAGLRANTVRNLHEFYTAFGVVEGDGLWLAEEERVRIF